MLLISIKKVDLTVFHHINSVVVVTERRPHMSWTKTCVPIQTSKLLTSRQMSRCFYRIHGNRSDVNYVHCVLSCLTHRQVRTLPARKGDDVDNHRPCPVLPSGSRRVCLVRQSVERSVDTDEDFIFNLFCTPSESDPRTHPLSDE